MAVSFNTTLHQCSLSSSCSIKLYSGLKPQSARSTRVWNPGNVHLLLFGELILDLAFTSNTYKNGQRFAMPLSRIALTSPAGAARGQADDIQNEAKELSRIRDYLFNELANNTGQPAERIFKDLSRVKRFNAEEAMEYGLIDKIVRPPRIKADAPRQDETSDEANLMLDLMVSKGCDPSIVTFNIIINGYYKAKLVDEGMRLFRKMSLRGVVANTVTYNTLIQGFCQSGKLNVAKELFQEMVSQGAYPDIVTWYFDGWVV
ncbi:hypothetical protein DY000_02057820 [Brassica cretica]|uniref:ATP-dependent Clp protease proteolytic subunit n=1 Tax=Brassica cretica TaxID=69181 RepID=A0ABQ7A714_BRACR|nr:hypothetical protein DY000_02057820 [Brassica cretica]